MNTIQSALVRFLARLMVRVSGYPSVDGVVTWQIKDCGYCLVQVRLR